MLEIDIHYAECDIGCTDQWCPYSHITHYCVGIKEFSTRDAAEKYIEACESIAAAERADPAVLK